MIDLAAREPARFQAMLNAYQAYRVENKVMPLPEGYTQMGQLLRNILRKELASPVVVGLLTLLLLLPFGVAYRMRRRKPA